MSELEKWAGMALIGTGQQSPKVPKDNRNSALMAVVRQLDWSQPEQAFLGAVGAIALHQHIGQRPHTTDLPPAPICETDDLPCCRAQSVRYISSVISDQPDLLPELLTLIVKANQRVPPQWLPKLLAVGRRRIELHPQIIEAIGKRGQWLAAQNPAWQYAQAADFSGVAANEPLNKEIWTSGNLSDRTSFLQQWRNVNPAAAREYLMSVWETAIVKNRTALIEALGVGLSMADEPFLEAALSDRSKGVRSRAVGLLSRLPGSSLHQRMVQRVQPFVQVEEAGQRLKIVVALPMLDHDPLAWKRDGIEPDSGRAGCLEQLVANVPLNHWQGDPADIVQAAMRIEHKDILLGGWSAAAKREHNAVWANALIEQVSLNVGNETILSNLFEVLSTERKETFLQTHQPTNSDDAASVHWLRLATQSNQVWSLPFSRLVLTQTLYLLERAQVYGVLFSMPANIAMVLHPQITPDAIQAVEKFSESKQSYTWASFTAVFTRVLTLRQAMHQSFANSS